MLAAQELRQKEPIKNSWYIPLVHSITQMGVYVHWSMMCDGFTISWDEDTVTLV